MQTKILTVLLALSAAVAIQSCQSDTASSPTGSGSKDTTVASGTSTTGTTTSKPTDTSSTKAGAGLVGKWSDHEFEGKDEYLDTVELRADGVFVSKTTYRLATTPPETGTETVQGTWSASGNKLTTTAGGQTFTGTYRIEGQMLILDPPDSPDPDTLKRVP